MTKFNYYLSKKPHRGFSVGQKVAAYIQVNNEYLTGVLRYFEVFSDSVYAVFGNYRIDVRQLLHYIPFMDGCKTQNAVQLSFNF